MDYKSAIEGLRKSNYDWDTIFDLIYYQALIEKNFDSDMEFWNWCAEIREVLREYGFSALSKFRYWSHQGYSNI